jgi:hypothetical protein
MASERQYRVHDAILVRRPQGSAWTLTFAPVPPEVPGAFDDQATREVVVTIPADLIDELSFQRGYSRSEIADLERGQVPPDTD